MKFKDRYELIGELQNANSGNARWGFVKDIYSGEEFFIKEFLSPKYPVKGTSGSKKVLERRKERCIEFEKRQKLLKDTILSKTAPGGNLVTTIDFFREGTKYYKISEKIDVTSFTIKDIYALKLEDKLMLMKTIAHSLKILHDLNILHADLKPDNILIKKTAKGLYTTKLIDFDDSFFINDIPKSINDLVGTMLYYSPEIANAIDKGDASSLTLKSDIYTLGLIYCQYLTGELPNYDRKKYDYPWEASLDDDIEIKDAKIPLVLKRLINNMLLTNKNERYSIAEVHQKLRNIKLDKMDFKEKKRIDSIYKKKRLVSMSSDLRGSLLESKSDNKSLNSKLRGSLLKK